ncbi:MAG TPA: polysaccharide deacetylase family protein [Pyrinomonadaceae bacterium]
MTFTSHSTESGARERSIPTLITLDVHEHPHLDAVLRTTGHLFAGEGRRVTYFVPSGFLLKSPGLSLVLRELTALGHSVGCHGLNHTPAEDLRSLSPEAERALLSDATRILEDALGQRVTSFRAPVFRLSNRTLPLLAELGYRADLSVTPQRLSFLSSTPWCVQWLWAPRAPYRPHRRSPYKRGDVNLLEIPTSSLLMPFAHATMTGIRSRGMSAMFDFLAWEARHFNRALVVQLHPESLTGEDVYYDYRKLRWTDFIPRRNGGFSLRYHFGDIPPDVSRRLTEEVLARIRARPELREMSVDDYLRTVPLPDVARASSEPARES